MPRGRAPGYALQREQILARAAELFARQGYTATSMNQVAAACGVSKPALYHYVDDKYRLLVEITEGHIARLRALVAEVAGEGLASEVRLRRLITRFVEAYADSQAAHRVLTEDFKFLDEADRDRVLLGQRAVVAAFADAIAAMRPELDSPGLTKPLSMLLFGMMNWMFTWLRPDGAISLAQIASIVADLFLGGLPAVVVPRPGSTAAPTIETPARRRAPRPERVEPGI
ncbi:MAG: TetR family transcriptional regulator [Proteobacteria bacterium]|nr:TetR family transcriptional regulator [Pseudomonadota bacterium]